LKAGSDAEAAGWYTPHEIGQLDVTPGLRDMICKAVARKQA